MAGAVAVMVDDGEGEVASMVNFVFGEEEAPVF